MGLYKAVFTMIFLVICFKQLTAQENPLKTGFYVVVANDSCKDSPGFLKIKDSDGEYCINTNPIVTQDKFTRVVIAADTSKEGIFNTVRIKLDSSFAQKFKGITEKLVGERIAFIIDNKIVAAPVLRDPIESGEIAVYADDETIKLIKEELIK